MVRDNLTEVRGAARKAALAREAFHAEVRKAHAAGATLRALSDAAGVSHETVRRICGE